MINIYIPLFITIKKKTKNNERVVLNFNNFKTMNQFKYNLVKKIFNDECEKIIAELFPDKYNPKLRKFNFNFKRIKVHYSIYLKNTNADLDNFTSILKKFFNDFMKKYGFIKDDTVLYIPETSEKFCGLAKDHHAIITILPK